MINLWGFLRFVTTFQHTPVITEVMGTPRYVLSRGELVIDASKATGGGAECLGRTGRGKYQRCGTFNL